MKYKPKFSIITAVYNHRPYLERLVQSLKSQTLQNFEWHICDDRSNDGSYEYLSETVKERDSWYIHRLNPFKWRARLAANWNKGVKHAVGDYCVFITGESFPELNFLEQIDSIAHPDKIICGVRIQVKDNEVVDIDWRLKKEVIPKATVLLPRNPYNLITGNGLVIPTEAMRKYGGWNEKFSQGGEDNEIVARLYYKGYLVYSVPQAIIYHNYHKSTDISERDEKIAKRCILKYAR